MNQDIFGFINLNKPAGLTSHDCVMRVRRLLKIKRVGHAGTLDPAATGVLPIAVGKATRLLQFLPQNKAYLATIRLGVRTTTDDLEGEAIAIAEADRLTLQDVEAVLGQFQGKIQQIPPNYSAIQVEGRRLYDLARKGEDIQVAARTVEVHEIAVKDWRSGKFAELDVAIACGPGTYIRSIARDLGEILQVGGTLAALQRTFSSGFSLTESLTLEALEANTQEQCLELTPPDLALKHLGMVVLPASAALRWCQGQAIKIHTPNLNGFVRVKHEDGRFLGIGQINSSQPEAVLAPQVVQAEI
ncbi:MAG: tRNA pseudouridine(55) synthase TruB [Desertifilum sp.]|nr:tRNA pseudouridine(55) synthase TruB [Desertifilum sp.]